MNNDMKLYYDYTVSPLGKLYYKTIFKQLEEISGKKVLDFGSGFGFLSNFLAQKNEVTAVEIDSAMIEQSENKGNYTQIHGGLQALEQFENETFDLVTCHLVLEFVDNPKPFLGQLVRVLKRGGTLSIVKHNKNGRVVQAVVQDFDIDDANKLMDGGFSFSSAFGDIKYYDNNDITGLTDNKLFVKHTFGARAVASLHSLETQQSEGWLGKMFQIETRLLEHEEFIKTAYFNHLLFEKTFN